MGANLEGWASRDLEVIRTVAEPLRENAGFLVLSGNLFDSALMKTSVISADFRKRFLSEPGREGVFEAKAVVFEGPEDYHDRINDASLGIDDQTILFIRGVGCVGYPGSAEVVNMQPPDALLKAGINHLPTVGDGGLPGLPQARADLVRRADRASGLFPHRVRRAPPLARRRTEYADLVALGQFLPGPASSQVGFAIGLRRGWLARRARGLGGLHAALGAGAGAVRLRRGGDDRPVRTRRARGLKIVAVAIVAQALLGMGRSLCPDPPRQARRARGGSSLGAVPGRWAWSARSSRARALGLALGRAGIGAAPVAGSLPVARQGWAALGAILRTAVAILVALPLVAAAGIGRRSRSSTASTAPARSSSAAAMSCCRCSRPRRWHRAGCRRRRFSRATARRRRCPGRSSPSRPISARLGPEPNGALGAALALAAIFLPGFLILVGVLPFWDRLRAIARRSRDAGRERGGRGHPRRGALFARLHERRRRGLETSRWRSLLRPPRRVEGAAVDRGDRRGGGRRCHEKEGRRPGEDARNPEAGPAERAARGVGRSSGARDGQRLGSEAHRACRGGTEDRHRRHPPQWVRARPPVPRRRGVAYRPPPTAVPSTSASAAAETGFDSTGTCRTGPAARRGGSRSRRRRGCGGARAPRPPPPR
jgi:chromate transport protein ChrA